MSENPYYLVASVEVGNTTTKCILTETDLRTGYTDVIEKHVSETSKVRSPKTNEKIIGHNITGLSFSREALSELVSEVVLNCFEKAGKNVEDVHYVARSSGIISQSSKTDAADEIIRALADGCFLAGISPSKMSGVLSADALPENISPFSKLSYVYFDGAVAGSSLPKWQGGSVVPNEMEGELACAGLKEAARHKHVDFRNPCVVIDMGTTLSGRILSKGNPYAGTLGNFCGYSGAIADFIVKDLINIDEYNDDKYNYDKYKNDPLCASNVFMHYKKPSFFKELKIRKDLKKATDSVNELLYVGKATPESKYAGPFEINPKKAEEYGVNIYVCDFYTSASVATLGSIGYDFYKKHGISGLSILVDEVMTDIVVRLLKSISLDYNLSDFKIGITGRAAISGNKQNILLKKLSKKSNKSNGETFSISSDKIVFTDDGLARGAAVMARCIHSLGCPKNPIGGNAGDSCILLKRKKHQNDNNKW